MKKYLLALAIVCVSITFVGCSSNFGCDACAQNNYMFNFSSSDSCCGGGTPW